MKLKKPRKSRRIRKPRQLKNKVVKGSQWFLLKREAEVETMNTKVGEVKISGSIEAPKQFDLVSAVERFSKHFKEVEKHFVERETELEQIKYAMLIKEHMLLKGKTGTAKSKLGKYSFGYVSDSKTFAIQLSKFMSEEYLFGAIDINKMRNDGKVEHRTEESVCDCEFAFIDEVFDGNDALLRSLLEVLNERTFTRHHQRVNCKLHSAVLTSNYVREDEVTEAFLDRILFKSDVKPVGGAKNRMDMYKSYAKHGDKGHHHLAKSLEKKGISYQELQEISNVILGDMIQIPEPVLKLYDTVIKEYCKQLNAYISDRKANKMLNILKASALLKGKMVVDFDDISSIKYAVVVTNNPQQEEVFKAVHSKIMNDALRFDKVVKEAEGLEAGFKELMKSASTKLNPKSKEILDLNDEVQLFEQKLFNHDFNNGSGFAEIDTKFQTMKQEVERIIREIQKTLKLNRS